MYYGLQSQSYLSVCEGLVPVWDQTVSQSVRTKYRGPSPCRGNDDTWVLRLYWTPLDTMDRIILLQWLHHLSTLLTSYWNYRISNQPVNWDIGIWKEQFQYYRVDRVYIRSFMDLTPAGKISISDFIEVRMFYVFPRGDSGSDKFNRY